MIKTITRWFKKNKKLINESIALGMINPLAPYYNTPYDYNQWRQHETRKHNKTKRK
jgi:hypothetical protein